MSISIVETFLEGDPVPSWLLDLESSEPGQPHCHLLFTADCHLVETTGGYHLIFDGSPPDIALLLAVGAGGRYRMVAPSRSVFTAVEVQVNTGADDEIAAIEIP